ncbi:MAG: PQQ-binding-like beta-propeller repeat protein, partial [Thermomicrobiales bacterium]
MSAGEHINSEMRLLEYWDNFLAGTPTLPVIDRGASELIHYLHENDDASWPDQEFATRTRELIVVGTEESRGIVKLGKRTICPANPTATFVVEESTWLRRSIWPIAAALCVALGIGYLFSGGSLPGKLADQWRDDPAVPALVAPADHRGTPLATPEPLASPSVSPELLSHQGSDVTMLFANPARLGDSEAVGPSGLPEIAWSFDTGRIFRSSPVVAGGVVYVGNTGGQFYAFDASSGEVIWQIETGGAVFSTALVAGDLVIVPAADSSISGSVIAFDRVTGTEKWRYPIGDQVFSDPVLYDGVVYLGTDDGFVHALDPDDGSEV